MKKQILSSLMFSALILSATNFAEAQNAADEQIDLQYSICEESGETSARQLGIEDLTPKISEVVYYDTNPPRYIQMGATFRLKIDKFEDGPLSSVKLRFRQKNPQSGASCEWDRYGHSESYTCDVQATEISASAPWSDEQKKYAAQRAQINWSELVAFGPYTDLTWKTKVGGYKFKLDSVNPPAPLRPLIELSVKVPYSERATAQTYIENYLHQQEIKLCQVQEAKTMRLFRNMGILR